MKLKGLAVVAAITGRAIRGVFGHACRRCRGGKGSVSKEM